MQFHALSASAGWISIKEVSDRLGLSPALMRLWESRYGWPCPRRTITGQRRFSAADVEEIRQVLALVRAGRPIGTLIRDGRADLPTVETTPRPPLAESLLAELPLPQRPLARTLRGELVKALRQRDGHSALRMLHQALRDCAPMDRDRAAWLPALALMTAWEESGHPLSGAERLRAQIRAHGGPERCSLPAPAGRPAGRAA
jgi:DNA-binding transcriptional MerR regulator